MWFKFLGALVLCVALLALAIWLVPTTILLVGLVAVLAGLLVVQGFGKDMLDKSDIDERIKAALNDRLVYVSIGILGLMLLTIVIAWGDESHVTQTAMFIGGAVAATIIGFYTRSWRRRFHETRGDTARWREHAARARKTTSEDALDK